MTHQTQAARHGIADLDQRPHKAGRPVMLDLDADWCACCKEMESQTLADLAVRERLAVDSEEAALVNSSLAAAGF